MDVISLVKNLEAFRGNALNLSSKHPEIFAIQQGKLAILATHVEPHYNDNQSVSIVRLNQAEQIEGVEFLGEVTDDGEYTFYNNEARLKYEEVMSTNNSETKKAYKVGLFLKK